MSCAGKKAASLDSRLYRDSRLQDCIQMENGYFL